MNTIVNRLLDVDRNARRMLDEAGQYHERILQETQREKDRLQKQYESRAEQHLRELREEQESEVAEARQQQNRQSEAVLGALMALYEENHTAWEDQLFSRALRGARGQQP